MPDRQTELKSTEKKRCLESIKKDMDDYLKLEEKLDLLQSAVANSMKDPNLSTELEALKQAKSSLLKKIVSEIEDSGLVNDMSKDIASVYLQIKKNA